MTIISRFLFNRSLFFSILTAAILAGPLAEPTTAKCRCKKAKVKESCVSLPILFATDRTQILKTHKDIDYGKQIVFPLDTINYGVKRVDTTADFSDKEEADAAGKLGWLVYPPELSKDHLKSDYLKQQSDFEVSHALAGGFDELVSKTRNRLDTSGKHQIVIFVHGCCLDFDGSMGQAAELASSVKAPVIAYCWGTSKGYAGSSVSFPRTQERFNKFMLQILSAFPNERVSIVCSSIGTQIVHNFCLQRRPEDYGDGSRLIDEIIYSRADLDDLVLKTQIDSLTRHSKKLIIFVSKNDFQINVSGTLRWFFYPSQHGERAGHLRSSLQTESPLTVLDVSPLKMGHVIPYDCVAELIDNKGEVPSDSRLFHYGHQDDNLYRVEYQKDERKHSASTEDALMK
jgi:esterase/lipase superfamily enzyme